MLADYVLGWEIVLKIAYLPSKLRFSAKYHFSDNLSVADIISRHTSRPKGLTFIY